MKCFICSLWLWKNTKPSDAALVVNPFPPLVPEHGSPLNLPVLVEEKTAGINYQFGCKGGLPAQDILSLNSVLVLKPFWTGLHGHAEMPTTSDKDLNVSDSLMMKHPFPYSENLPHSNFWISSKGQNLYHLVSSLALRDYLCCSSTSSA